MPANDERLQRSNGVSSVGSNGSKVKAGGREGNDKKRMELIFEKFGEWEVRIIDKVGRMTNAETGKRSDSANSVLCVPSMDSYVKGKREMEKGNAGR